MFQINDIVLYNQTDVCRVQEIRRMPFLNEERIDYYVLKPVYEDSPGNSTLYVPVNSHGSRLRRAFTAQELTAMLESGAYSVPWIEAPMLRKKEYTELLSRSHPGELIALIRTISAQRSAKLRAGHKFSEADEKYLALAEKRLFPLFRYILNVEWEDFLPLITGERAPERLDLASL